MDSPFFLYVVFMCVLSICFCVIGCVALLSDRPVSPSQQELRQMIREYVEEALRKRGGLDAATWSIPASMIDTKNEVR